MTGFGLMVEPDNSPFGFFARDRYNFSNVRSQALLSPQKSV